MRKPRADAIRNRERVLLAAREAFAGEGPGVSLDDVARRAGVGAGTVHRHFPTKDALFAAVIADRLADLARQAHDMAGADTEPGPAFFTYFDLLATESRHNLALTAALTEPAAIGTAVRDAGRELQAGLDLLLVRAQQARAVRPDLTVADLHAILAGALVMEQRLAPESAGRGLAVITAGLRPTTDRPDPG